MNNFEKTGIAGQVIDQIISILKCNPAVEKVILFGSRAIGSYKNGSDVDLLLIGEELELKDVLDASIQIDDLFLPYKVDLILYDRIEEPSLLEHIDRVGITLYDRLDPRT